MSKKNRKTMAEHTSDHDTLITLVETNKQQFGIIIDKIDNVKSDIANLKDGWTKEVAALNVRLEAIESLHNELQPRKLAAQVLANSEWINTFKISYKALIGVIVAASSIITFLLTTFLHLSNLLGK